MEKYKTTKAVRFRLNAVDGCRGAVDNMINGYRNKDGKFELVEFVGDVDRFLNVLARYLFRKNKDGTLNTGAYDGKIIVKNDWLRRYVRGGFADHKENAKQDKKKEYTKLADVLNKPPKEKSADWDDSFGITAGDVVKEAYRHVAELNKTLTEYSKCKPEEFVRKSQTGLQLKRLNASNALPLLIDFVKESSDKDVEYPEKGDFKNLSINLARQAELLEVLLRAGVREFLPSQSGGAEVAGASFNYNTVSRSGSNLTKKRKEQKEKLEVNVVTIENSAENGSRGLIRQINVNVATNLEEHLWVALEELLKKNRSVINLLEPVKAEIIQCVKNKFGELPPGAPLLYGASSEHKYYASLRDIFKEIKSTQRSKFNEMIQINKDTGRRCTFEELISSEHYLFGVDDDHREKYEDAFNRYIEKSNEIDEYKKETGYDVLRAERKELQEAGKTVPKELKDKIEEVKGQLEIISKARGDILKDEFDRWNAFSKLYQVVAQRHGLTHSRLKGIDNAETEANKMLYWALIIENGEQRQLALIPRDKMKECKDELKKLKNSAQANGGAKLYWFESLTLGGLRKFCCNEDNNNYKHNLLPEEILEKYRFPKGEYSFKGNEKRIIEFYMNVLKRYAGDLGIVYENINKAQPFEKLDGFKKAIEKNCYAPREVVLSGGVELLIKKFDAQIFVITSLDLENPLNVKDKDPKYEHIDKRPTKFWKDFWEQEKKDNIRLNPNIKIIYREAIDYRVKKYGEEKSKDKSVPYMHNRYTREQFTLVTTMSENCNAPAIDLSFASGKKIWEEVEKFNSGLKKENVKFAIGIDNGEAELSSLSVYMKEFEDIDKLKDLEKYRDAHGFDVWEITKEGLNEKIKMPKRESTKKEFWKLIENPSYFLNKRLYKSTFAKDDFDEMFKRCFKPSKILSINLTTAKLFTMDDGCEKKKIILTNGDIMGYYRLWLRHARRTVFFMKPHIKDKTSINVVIKDRGGLTDDELVKFGDSEPNVIYGDKKEVEKLSREEKISKVKKYLEKMKSLLVLFASKYNADDLQMVTPILCHHVFLGGGDLTKIKDIDTIKEEIKDYNKDITSHNIPEEIDLKITNGMRAIAANVVGIVEHLYQHYQDKTNGGVGLIVKEGFTMSKIEKDRKNFGGNIYATLERALFRKLQSKCAVPPIKSMKMIKEERIAYISGEDKKDNILRLGNLAFVSEWGTSQKCPNPNCKDGRLKHTLICKKCESNFEKIFHSNDGLAGYNIAKRGYNNLGNEEKLPDKTSFNKTSAPTPTPASKMRIDGAPVGKPSQYQKRRY